MLDVREQGGYDRLELAAEIVGGPTVEAITWIAGAANPWHLGRAPAAAMAAEIRAAVGPSGRNLDYVLRLHEALGELGFQDAHLAAIVVALRHGEPAPAA
jgi:cation transport regulator ChaC